MKFFVAFAALVALTVASPLSKPVDSDLAALEAIIAAINSPNTDPATAALLEEQLGGIIAELSPISVGPAIIPHPEIVEKPEPIAIGPAIIPPKPDGGAVAEEPIVPGPALVVPGPAPSADASNGPLVQIVVNVNQAAAEAVAVGPAVESAPVNPIVRPEPIGRPEPVGEIPAEPVQVVEVAPEPVQVVEVAPVQVEPVQIGVPIIPEAAVVLPEELN